MRRTFDFGVGCLRYQKPILLVRRMTSVRLIDRLSVLHCRLLFWRLDWIEVVAVVNLISH